MIDIITEWTTTGMQAITQAVMSSKKIGDLKITLLYYGH